MNWVHYLFLLIVFEIVADVFAKQYSIENKMLFFIIALFFYVIANVSWLISMNKKSQLAISANIFSVSTGLIALLIGCLLYGESITVRQLAGIILGIISIILIF